MFIGYRQGAIVAFEDYAGAKRVFVTDNGKVAVVGMMEDQGWWMQTPDDYDQGSAGVTLEELRSRVGTVQSAIEACGLPKDNITALAVAIVGLDSAGWADGFNANDFHKGVIGLSPHVLTNEERGTTTIYGPNGVRMCDVALSVRRGE
jgi:hypothetical protein